MPVLCGWLFNFAYVLLILLASPVLLYRMLIQGKYRHGLKEKFLGLLPRRSREPRSPTDPPCIWFHAVSVGEVLQLQPLVKRMAAGLPHAEFVITTTTSTGQAVAREKFPSCRIHYCPLDFTWAVRRAVDRIRPSMLVLVELELWPNLIRIATASGVPVTIVNGRLGDRSFRGYRRLRWIFAPLLSRLTWIGVQNETYAERFRALGARTAAVEITGSIKFDLAHTPANPVLTDELRSTFRIGRGDVVWIAGSTQAPEEQFALDAWLNLRKEFPHLRLLLVPRHKERFDEVARMVQSRGLPLLRRSDYRGGGHGTARQEVPSPCASTGDRGVQPVLLLDTLGELSACWALADIAFVGGSLTNRGGQNMLEPAARGIPVLFGPNTWNFRDAAEGLLAAGGAQVVHDRHELEFAVRGLLADSSQAERMGCAAAEFVGRHRGAADRTVARLIALLSEADSRADVPERQESFPADRHRGSMPARRRAG